MTDRPAWLADLDWDAECERRAHEATVPDRFKYLRDWGDVTGLAQALGAAGLPEFGAAGAAPGLVSIPTSDKRPSQAYRFERGTRVADLGAFSIDTDARRLSQLRMHVGVAARCHVAEQEAGTECAMVTLTYAGTNEDWSPRHISAFLKHCREWCRRNDQPFRYVWVAELQKRGVIHYHVAIWLPPGVRLPKPDEQGWWPHGMTRIEIARAAVPYLLKYLSKDMSKSHFQFPKGARIYGCGGLAECYRGVRRWLRYPGFIRANADSRDVWRRAEGGGWTAPDGVHWPSEFKRSFVGGVATLVRVARHGAAFAADGPYSRVSGAPRSEPGPLLHRGPDIAARVARGSTLRQSWLKVFPRCSPTPIGAQLSTLGMECFQ